MQPQELFGVGVRCIGLWWAVQAAVYFCSGIDLSLQLSGDKFDDERVRLGTDIRSCLFAAMAYSLLGAILLRRTHVVVNFTYGPTVATTDEPSSTTPADDSSPPD